MSGGLCPRIVCDSPEIVGLSSMGNWISTGVHRLLMVFWGLM
jgi:hypothetical protein